MAADAAVTFLLEKVTGVIVGYADLISGAGEEFKQLQKDVNFLKAHLDGMSSNSSKIQREIQDQVREVVYDVEDTIDSWLTDAAASKDKGKFKCFAKWFSPTHLGLANDVKTLRQGRVKEIHDMIIKMGPAVGGTSKEQQPSVTSNAGTLSKLRQDKVVKAADTEGIIIGLLTKHQEELDIIPVIGMPGLGKTTMVGQIFNDDRICSAFPMRIWVQFSERFNIEEVFVKIMNQISQGKNNKDGDLAKIIRACLEEEKFLLVCDDVWETEHWDAIRYALPYSNSRGKVLITSRHMTVGIHVQHITTPCKQSALDDDEGWKLLQFEVFGNLESCPEELKSIGKYIAKACKGVPLTIILMGAVLKDHYWKLQKSPVPVKKKWEETAKNVNLTLEDKKKVILEAVEMSYNNLPDHLRDCFLYLGVFPEGYEIPSWAMTSLWIAEGFIKPHEGKSLEEVAKDNLDELINRNLLMAHKINPMQEVKVCSVHDMIRVFCRTKASEEKLFEEIKMLDNQISSNSEMDKIRRLCLHSNLSTFFSSKLKGPHVRSFLSFGKEVIGLEPEYDAVISECFSRLRLLQSKSIKFNQFPESITKLAHLRYIVLCIPKLEKLPQSLSQLWNLQTIAVDTNSDELIMEANIWKMIHLRHVKTKAAIVLDDKWEGVAGKNIQILNRLSPKSVTAAFTRKASNLKTLGIRGKLATLFDEMSLQKLNHLEKLKLYHEVNENRLQKFPGHKRFPPELKRLTLSNTSLKWEHMSTVACIGDLEVLKLKNNAFEGMTWKAVNYVFPSLQFLLIDTTDLVFWEDSAGAFPCIRHLVLKKCKKLDKIPDLVLQRLENLEIENVCKSTADSVRKSRVDLVPSIGPGCDK